MFRGKTSNKYYTIGLEDTIISISIYWRYYIDTKPSLAYILDIRSYDIHLLYYKIYNYYKYTNLNYTIEVTYVYNKRYMYDLSILEIIVNSISLTCSICGEQKFFLIKDMKTSFWS